MKILHTVEYYYPSIGGAQEVVKQLSEHLVKMGHDVTVVTSKLKNRKNKVINGVKIKEFEVSGNAVRGYSGKDIENYKKYLLTSEFDVIMNYAAQQWTADLTFEIMNKIKAKKVFVPCGFSGLHLPEYNQYFKDMAKILKSYDATIYMSNTYRDIEYAKKFKVRNILIIPNGADEKEFAMRSVDKDIIKNRLGIRRKDFLILHVGSHTGVKGHKEVISAFKKAAIKNATLLIVGNQGACLTQCTRKAQLNNIFRRNNKLIKILDLSRSETIKAYYAADAFITLSNIECSPLVLFEAAAAGIPFIANKSGNSVEITSWLKNGLIAQSKQDKFGHTSTEINSAVKRIEELYSNKKLRLDYGKSGRNNWQKKYTWSKITNSYQSLYKKLVAKG